MIGFSSPRKVTDAALSCPMPQNHSAYAKIPLITTR